MPSYNYVARDGDGNLTTGTVPARDLIEVRATLRNKDLFVTKITEDAAGGKVRDIGESVPFWRRRVNLNDMVVMSRQLATLVRAGLSIVECLYGVSVQAENPYLALVLQDIRVEVLGGASLAQAMRKHPKVFNETYVSLVQAGEAGGMLEQVLEIAAEQLDKEAEIRAKIKSAMTYPIIVVVAAVAVVIFMLCFIVPVFATVYEQFHAVLPPVTLLLVTSSDVILHKWWMVAIALTVFVLLFRAYASTARGQWQLDALKLKLPLLMGKLLRKVAIARFAQTLAGLSKAGVPILQALAVGANTSGNLIIIDAIRKVALAVQEGAPMSAPMAASGQFPHMVTQMVAAGEQSGNMDEMLEEITRFYNRDIYYTVEKLTKMMEPAMTVVVGAIVLFVLLALYMPIFNLTQVLRAK